MKGWEQESVRRCNSYPVERGNLDKETMVELVIAAGKPQSEDRANREREPKDWVLVLPTAQHLELSC